MARVADLGNNFRIPEPVSDGRRRVVITPSDTADIADPKPTTIYFSTAGTLTYLDKDGTSRLVSGGVGTALKGFFKRIMATGTTATISRED